MQSKKLYKRKNVVPYTVDIPLTRTIYRGSIFPAQRQGRWSDIILCLTNPATSWNVSVPMCSLRLIVYGIASPGTKCDFKKRFRSALCRPVGYLSKNWLSNDFKAYDYYCAMSYDPEKKLKKPGRIMFLQLQNEPFISTGQENVQSACPYFWFLSNTI